MIRPRHLADSIVARLISVSAFSHSLDQEETYCGPARNVCSSGFNGHISSKCRHSASDVRSWRKSGPDRRSPCMTALCRIRSRRGLKRFQILRILWRSNFRQAYLPTLSVRSRQGHASKHSIRQMRRSQHRLSGNGRRASRVHANTRHCGTAPTKMGSAAN